MVAPCLAKASARERPIPRTAPVMMTTLLLKEFMSEMFCKGYL